jgi:hypothetical protein
VSKPVSQKSSFVKRSLRSSKTDFLNSLIVSAMVVNPTLSRKTLAVSKLCLIEVCEAVNSMARYIHKFDLDEIVPGFKADVNTIRKNAIEN